jgi:two-component system, sensor histidine kinase and response regulator
MNGQTKILVIDDEPGIREGCRRALTPQGYIVDTAENGEQGMQKVLQGNYDLVLIDIMMPGIGGIDLIEQIHAHDPEIVCIIITGFATVEIAVSAIKRGAYDFLTKPFTTDDLFLVVNQGKERRQFSLETKRLQTIEAEAKRLAEEKTRLEELDRAKVAFIRLVTHELQAPIAAISTYLDLIINGYIAPGHENEYLERAQERAKEQIALISDLLEFGRLKELTAHGKAERVQMEVVLGEVVEQYESQATAKGINLTVNISENIPAVLLPAEQAKSIWTNLLSNALKYTAEGGQVDASLSSEAGRVLGQVRDTGIGIPEKAMSKLFSEFYRADNAKAMNIPGTGLGLAIIKEILERAGGEIRVESTEGEGTTFYFTLPAAEQTAD